MVAPLCIYTHELSYLLLSGVPYRFYWLGSLLSVTDSPLQGFKKTTDDTCMEFLQAAEC